MASREMPGFEEQVKAVFYGIVLAIFYGNCLVFCPNSSVKFWLRLFVPCFSHFFVRCAASNSKIASPDPKINYPKFNELLVQNTWPSGFESKKQAGFVQMSRLLRNWHSMPPKDGD